MFTAVEDGGGEDAGGIGIPITIGINITTGLEIGLGIIKPIAIWNKIIINFLILLLNKKTKT